MYYNNIIIHVFYISLKDLKGGNSDNYDEYRIPSHNNIKYWFNNSKDTLIIKK